MLSVENKVGALAKIAKKLATKRVNINYMYGSTGRGRAKANIVISTDRIATAQKLLTGL